MVINVDIVNNGELDDHAPDGGGCLHNAAAEGFRVTAKRYAEDQQDKSNVVQRNVGKSTGGHELDDPEQAEPADHQV